MDETIVGATAVQAVVPEQQVEIHPATSPGVQVQRLDPSRPAMTTFQEDLTTAGQRRINLIWEWTQAVIAGMVVLTTMIAGIYTLVVPTISVGTGAATVQVPLQIPSVIGIAFGMVTGFYFSRTNHAAIGGIGPKPGETQQYQGR